MRLLLPLFALSLLSNAQYNPYTWTPVSSTGYDYRRDGVVTRTFDLCFGLPGGAGNDVMTCYLWTDIYCDTYTYCPASDGIDCPSGGVYYDRCAGNHCVRQYALEYNASGVMGYCKTGIRGEPDWPELLTLCPDCTSAYVDPCALNTNVCFDYPNVCAYNTIPCPAGEFCDPTNVQCTRDVTSCTVHFIADWETTFDFSICDTHHGFGCATTADPAVVECVRRTAANCSDCPPAVTCTDSGLGSIYRCNDDSGKCEEVYVPRRGYGDQSLSYRFCDSGTFGSTYETFMCEVGDPTLADGDYYWNPDALACIRNNVPCDDGNATTYDGVSPPGDPQHGCRHCLQSDVTACNSTTFTCNRDGTVTCRAVSAGVIAALVAVPAVVLAASIAALLAVWLGTSGGVKPD